MFEVKWGRVVFWEEPAEDKCEDAEFHPILSLEKKNPEMTLSVFLTIFSSCFLSITNTDIMYYHCHESGSSSLLESKHTEVIILWFRAFFLLVKDPEI